MSLEAADARINRAREYGVAEAVMTRRFWVLWTLLFVNVSAGIMVLSQVSPMAQEIAGLSPLAATAMVGLISLANAAGRVFWAWVSDAIGRGSVFVNNSALYALAAVMLVATLLPLAARRPAPARHAVLRPTTS
jgi:OFA family oxalate/formate antiporter-like MFS transporter